MGPHQGGPRGAVGSAALAGRHLGGGVGCDASQASPQQDPPAQCCHLHGHLGAWSSAVTTYKGRARRSSAFN